MLWIGDHELRFGRSGQDRPRHRVLRPLLRHRCRRQHLPLVTNACRPYLDHPWLPEGHRPRLVEDHGVDGTESLEEEAALHDGPDPRSATDGAQDGEGRAGRNSAGARHDDHGDGRASIPREREREGRTGQGEVDEVSRETVSQLLDGRSRAFCQFDRLDDLAEGCAAADAGRRDLEHPRAVDGASEDGCARSLLHRHRLTSDRRLVHGRPASRHDSVHRNAGAGLHDDQVTWGDARGLDLLLDRSSLHERGLGQEIDQVSDGPAAPRDREPFEHLRDEDEQHDDERREYFADAHRRADGEGHRELHRHPTFAQRQERLAEDGVSADDHSHNSHEINAREAGPPAEPGASGHDGGERDAHELASVDPTILGVR